MSKTILVYGDSMSWGIIPNSRNRLPFSKRWTGVLQRELGEEYRINEACLNGRTTRYNDPNRPARNGLESLQMVMESHSPVDLLVVMLGINDFQDVIGATAGESAEGLRKLIRHAQSLAPEPMSKPAEILVILPPDIEQSMGAMAQKFSCFKRGLGAESAYLAQLEGLEVSVLRASEVIKLSRIDGIHIDEPEHGLLGRAVASAVKDLFG